LLLKLNWYGITGKASNWIKSYLVDRYPGVEIKNTNFSHQIASKWGKIKHGIPRVSILGPLLFSLEIFKMQNGAIRIIMGNKN
jgi:hypothetical protein